MFYPYKYFEKVSHIGAFIINGILTLTFKLKSNFFFILLYKIKTNRKYHLIEKSNFLFIYIITIYSPIYFI